MGHSGIYWQKWATSTLALLLAVLGGCQTGVAPGAPKTPTCQCSATDPCPTSRCDLQIELSAATCGGQAATVEVMVGDELEPETYAVGKPRRSCATLARGATALLQARSNTTWQWAEEVICPAASPGDTQGPTIVRVLNCTAAKP